jgi:hypothetical protein
MFNEEENEYVQQYINPTGSKNNGVKINGYMHG